MLKHTIAIAIFIVIIIVIVVVIVAIIMLLTRDLCDAQEKLKLQSKELRRIATDKETLSFMALKRKRVSYWRQKLETSWLKLTKDRMFRTPVGLDV